MTAFSQLLNKASLFHKRISSEKLQRFYTKKTLQAFIRKSKMRETTILQQEFVETFLTERAFQRRELHLPCVHHSHRLTHTHTLRPTQPCIPLGSLNQVPASAGGKGTILTSAG